MNVNVFVRCVVKERISRTVGQHGAVPLLADHVQIARARLDDEPWSAAMPANAAQEGTGHRRILWHSDRRLIGGEVDIRSAGELDQLGAPGVGRESGVEVERPG